MQCQPGKHQRHDDGGRSGYGGDQDLVLDGSSHQRKAGIRDSRCAGIAHQSDMLALTQQIQQMGQGLPFVEGMEGDLRFADPEMLEQKTGLAGVFADHIIDLLERFDATQGHITEVADGGGNDVQHNWL